MSTLNTATDGRTELGLGTAATYDTGTTAGQIPLVETVSTGLGWTVQDYIDAGTAIKAWTGNPGNSTSSALSFGRMQFNKLWLRTAATISNITVFLTVAGSGLTSSQNFAALLDASGNQVGLTADQTTAWATTGAKTMALTTPYVAAVGGYYVVLLPNGTTTVPTVACHGSTSSSALNFGLAAASPRAAQSGAGNTSIPSSVTLSSQTVSAVNFMAVLT